MAGRDFGPPPYIVPEFSVIWRNWLNLVYRKIYKRSYTIELQATNSVSPPSNPMVDGVIGVAPVALADDTTNESRHLAFAIPVNWITGTQLTLNIHYANTTTQTGVKTIVSSVTYNAIAPNEVASGGGTVITDTLTLANNVVANTFHISGNLIIPASALALGDTVFIQLVRAAANDTCVGDVGFQNIVVTYTGFLNQE